MQEILIYIEEGYADWEIAHLGYQIKSTNKYDVKTLSKTKDSLFSMSHLYVTPDYDVNDIHKSDISKYKMLVLCGGMFWSQAQFVNEDVRKLVDLFIMNKLPVAAICDATTFLAFNGYLENVEHTGNTIHHIIQSCPNYQGHKYYVNRQCVSGEQFITANGTSVLEFARDILKRLSVKPDKEIEAWYQFRKKGIYSE
jgi:putative intracellular protease/amidase